MDICIFCLIAFYQMSLTNIFFRSVACLLIPLILSFKEKVFNFNEVEVISYCWMNRAFGVISKKSFPYLGLSRFSPVIFKDFYSFAFTFRSVIHFELILVKGISSLFIFVSFWHVDVQHNKSVPALLLKRLSFPILIDFAPLPKKIHRWKISIWKDRSMGWNVAPKKRSS